MYQLCVADYSRCWHSEDRFLKAEPVIEEFRVSTFRRKLLWDTEKRPICHCIVYALLVKKKKLFFKRIRIINFWN